MIFKSIFFFIFAISINGDLIDFSMPLYGTALSSVLVDYTTKMISIKPLVNFIQVSHPENTINQLYIMNEVLYHSNRKDGTFRIINDVNVLPVFSLKMRARKRVNTIIFVDSFESFYEVFNHIDLEHWDYGGNYVIVITQHLEEIYGIMTKIFEAFWTKHIVNVVVIFSPHANTFEVMLYTYYPFSAFYCEHAVPVQLNHYRGNKYLTKLIYFPDKLSNFHGCPVSVVTFKNPPFMFYDLNENGNVYVDGIDGIVLRVLAKQLNFNITLNIDPEQWGIIYDNGTITGAMRWINEDKINMTIGFFASLPGREKILKSSYVYYTTNLIWIVPPGKPQSPLKKLLNPLENIIWIFFSIILLIAFSTIAILKMAPKEIQNFVFGSKTSSPALNLINVVLGNSLYQLPFRNFSRFLFMIFTFHCFILRSSYQGGLVKFMQLDTREPKMMNTNEMLEKNFSFYFVDSAVAYLEEIPKVKSRGYLLAYEDYNKKLQQVSNPNLQSAFLTSESHLAYRNRVAFPDYMNFAPESVFSLNLVIYMQRDSCLKRPIDDILVRLVCSGLINKWASYWIDNKYMKEPPQDSLQILSLEQLRGALDLLVYGLFAGFVAFCFEILGYGIIKVVRIVKNWFE